MKVRSVTSIASLLVVCTALALPSEATSQTMTAGAATDCPGGKKSCDGAASGKKGGDTRGRGPSTADRIDRATADAIRESNERIERAGEELRAILRRQQQEDGERREREREFDAELERIRNTAPRNSSSSIERRPPIRTEVVQQPFSGFWSVNLSNDSDQWVYATVNVTDCVEVGLGCGTFPGFLLSPYQALTAVTVTRAACTNPTADPGYCNRKPQTSFNVSHTFTATVKPKPRVDDAEAKRLFGMIQGTWVRRAGSQDDQTRTQIEETLYIGPGGEATLERTTTTSVRGYTGWRKQPAERDRIAVFVDGAGGLTGGLDGRLRVLGIDRIAINNTIFERK
jgi:hypothetical protein